MVKTYIHLAISERRRFKHITAFSLLETDPEFLKWVHIYALVTSWIIENSDPNIVNQFLDYSNTALYSEIIPNDYCFSY